MEDLTELDKFLVEVIFYRFFFSDLFSSRILIFYKFSVRQINLRLRFVCLCISLGMYKHICKMFTNEFVK